LPALTELGTPLVCPLCSASFFASAADIFTFGVLFVVLFTFFVLVVVFSKFVVALDCEIVSLDEFVVLFIVSVLEF
jgi:hypothetical protein